MVDGVLDLVGVLVLAMAEFVGSISGPDADVAVYKAPVKISS